MWYKFASRKGLNIENILNEIYGYVLQDVDSIKNSKKLYLLKSKLENLRYKLDNLKKQLNTSLNPLESNEIKKKLSDFSNQIMEAEVVINREQSNILNQNRILKDYNISLVLKYIKSNMSASIKVKRNNNKINEIEILLPPDALIHPQSYKFILAHEISHLVEYLLDEEISDKYFNKYDLDYLYDTDIAEYLKVRYNYPKVYNRGQEYQQGDIYSWQKDEINDINYANYINNPTEVLAFAKGVYEQLRNLSLPSNNYKDFINFLNQSSEHTSIYKWFNDKNKRYYLELIYNMLYNNKHVV